MLSILGTPGWRSFSRAAADERIVPGLQAPFPWFGGKSRVAPIVWDLFGDVPNYVEPFFGSGAVLLGRPAWHNVGMETANDKDGYVANVWRALSADPDGVAAWADWPVNEADLHARHLWLRERSDSLVGQLMADPDYYDAQIAGWWLWGMASWIGAGFCGPSGSGPWGNSDGRFVHLGNHGRGVKRQLVHLGDAGRGVARRRVHLKAGQGVARHLPSDGLQEWCRALQQRLRYVRVSCGDWRRVCGYTPTLANGVTGVFLDPPYSSQSGRDPSIYATEDLHVAQDVCAWAIAHGDHPDIRIILCGYEGEHRMPKTWLEIPWSTSGGYANLGSGPGQLNRHRERLWASPACRVRQSRLWA